MSVVQQAFSDLPQDVSRILYVTFPADITSALLYQFFGQFGALQDLRLKEKHDEDAKTGRGGGVQNGFVVFHDVFDAQNAFKQLNSTTSSVQFITARYFTPTKNIIQEF
jgi:hypothetical protein